MEHAVAEKGRSNVGRLRLRLVTIALLSMLIILSAAAYGIYRVYARHVLQQAGETAVQVGEALLAGQRDLLFDAGGLRPLAGDPPRRERLDRHLRGFLRPFGIVKIKVYDAGARVVYSTDPAVVGQVDGGNARLQRALRGEVDSHLERKEAVRDLADEQKFDVDVVETYMPVRHAGAVAGAFEVYLDVTRFRDEIRGGVASSVAVLGAILVLVFSVSFLFVAAATSRLADAESRLRKLAMRDVLTGALNRGAILAHAREELARYGRRRQQRNYGLSFILLDVDHFKRINDTHGHPAGDQVLRELAERVQGALRNYDQFGRFGGEEFLLILPDATLDGACFAAERIRQAVCEAPFACGETELTVTVSLGVASTVPGEEDLAAVLKRADIGLYLAKDRGRNQVAWASDLPPAASPLPERR